MKKRILYILAIIGLVGIFSSCEEDGEKVIFSSNVIPPSFEVVPELTLQRSNATDTLIFTANPVDPGFTASAVYTMEACAEGNNFADVVEVYSGNKVDTIKVSVSELNSLLLDILPSDVQTSLDLRLTAVLVVDAGTGAVGTSTDPLEYISETLTVSAMVYGLPRLDLVGSGMDQNVKSRNGDGNYEGIVKLDPASPFTLLDPDSEVSYGGSSGTLAVDGAGIVSTEDGWSMLTVNINDMTYEIAQHSMGIIGSAVPVTGWDSDINMDYNAEDAYWYITLDLIPGAVKFRLNDGWAWNMGFVEGTENPGLSGPTQQGGVGNDIPITEAGNYTAILYVYSDSEGEYVITKN